MYTLYQVDPLTKEVTKIDDFTSTAEIMAHVDSMIGWRLNREGQSYLPGYYIVYPVDQR